MRNIASAFAERESLCKYYFIDNGILSLQLIGGENSLLENMVALSLFRIYGHDEDNARVFFYHTNVEVDFYVPEEGLAIQVAHTIAGSDTLSSEAGALGKLPLVHQCHRRVIITYDEEGILTDKFGTIEIIPCWKWLLETSNK